MKRIVASAWLILACSDALVDSSAIAFEPKPQISGAVGLHEFTVWLPEKVGWTIRTSAFRQRWRPSPDIALAMLLEADKFVASQWRFVNPGAKRGHAPAQ